VTSSGDKWLADVALVDAGDGRRLDRFGERLVDRPHPAAWERRPRPGAWAAADLRFDREGGWTGPADSRSPWTVSGGRLTLELRATESGGVGLYPEHAANAAWLAAEVAALSARAGRGDLDANGGLDARADGRAAPAVLNLFAHTGLLTLVAAAAGASVTHVDAARGAVAWARRNAELSGLADRPIRWIVDDALGFVRREARRGRRYDGILLDPPTYGHGRPGSRNAWRFDTDLPALLGACVAVASKDAVVLVTAHATGLEADQLAGAVREAFPVPSQRADTLPLELEAESGARLQLGLAVRVRA